MSGTHGDLPESETQSGVSGLTDKNMLVDSFYKEDCELVGIKAGPNRSLANLPINWQVLQNPIGSRLYPDQLAVFLVK